MVWAGVETGRIGLGSIVIAFLRSTAGPFIWSGAFCLVTSPFLLLEPLDTHFLYAHTLFLSTSLYIYRD